MVSAWSVGLTGIDGFPVEVEAALGGGLPRVQLVGLPDASLSEAKARVRAAVLSSGWDWHGGLITFNLSPASKPKGGSHYDLALAVAALIAQRQLSEDAQLRTVLFGELSLGGGAQGPRCPARHAGGSQGGLHPRDSPRRPAAGGRTGTGHDGLGGRDPARRSRHPRGKPVPEPEDAEESSALEPFFEPAIIACLTSATSSGRTESWRLRWPPPVGITCSSMELRGRKDSCRFALAVDPARSGGGGGRGGLRAALAGGS